MVSVVSGQVTLELYVLMVVSSGGCLVIVLIPGGIRKQPRVDGVQYLDTVPVYLVAHNVRRLQADLRPLSGQCPGVR